MNSKSATEYAQKITELATGHHKIILQDTIKKKERKKKVQPLPEEPAVVPESASAPSDKQATTKVKFSDSVEDKHKTTGNLCA
jgi:hypothetical protein